MIIKKLNITRCLLFLSLSFISCMGYTQQSIKQNYIKFEQVVERSCGMDVHKPAFSQSGIKEKSNILLIMVDDMNDWVGCLGGHPNALTPNIDKLAAKGVLFTHAYCWKLFSSLQIYRQNRSSNCR